ncbi:hypothetical protein ISR94_02985 [Candidatus Microgenomates bacterium]|nr:hypothetical protein [Candidatus Microgenomates bacterium]
MENWNQIKKSARRSRERKGEESEKKADMSLELLLEQGTIDAFWYDPKKDRTEGIDRVIQTRAGDELGIQIKSSKTGAEYHKKKFPHIPVIIVEYTDNTERIANKIKSVLREKSF